MTAESTDDAVPGPENESRFPMHPFDLVEVAAYEGVEMSRYTLSWKDSGEVGNLRPGAKLYASRTDIELSKLTLSGKPLSETFEIDPDDRDPASTIANVTAWVGNQRHYPRNIVTAITRFPAGIDDKLKEVLKTIFERHVVTCSGLRKSLDTTTVERLRAGAKNVREFQSEVTSEGSPVYKVYELLNYPIFNALVEYSKKHVAGKSESELSEDGLEFTIFEPDATHRKVVNAWVIKGVFFNGVQQHAERDVARAKELVSYEIIVDGKHEQDTEAMIAKAQAVLDAINTINAQPTLRA